MCDLEYSVLEHIEDNQLLLNESDVLSDDINLLIMQHATNANTDTLKLVTESVIKRWYGDVSKDIDVNNMLNNSVVNLLKELCGCINVKDLHIDSLVKQYDKLALTQISNLYRFEKDSGVELEGSYIRELSVFVPENNNVIYIGNDANALKEQLLKSTCTTGILEYADKIINVLEYLNSNLENVDVASFLEDNKDIFDINNIFTFKDKICATLNGVYYALCDDSVSSIRSENDKFHTHYEIPTANELNELILFTQYAKTYVSEFNDKLKTLSAKVDKIKDIASVIINNLSNISRFDVYSVINLILKDVVDNLYFYIEVYSNNLYSLYSGLSGLLENSVIVYNSEIVSDFNTLEHTNLIVSEKQRELDALENDMYTLHDDFKLTVNLLDGLDSSDNELTTLAVENYNVALKNIRTKWDIKVSTESYGKSNRTLVRESMWDSISDFFKKIADWIKENVVKLKTKWVEITNKGVKMQKRADEFLARINKAGNVSKVNTINGNFIKQLSVGNAFKGDDVSTIGDAIKACYNLRDTQSDVVVSANQTIKLAANTSTDTAKINISANDVENKYTCKSDDFKPNKPSNIIGHKTFNWTTVSNENDTDVSIDLEDTDGDFPSEVEVPTKDHLRNIINAYKKAGADIEKISINYVEMSRKLNNLSDSSNKLVRILSNKSDDNDELKSVVNTARNILKGANVVNSGVERTVTHLMGCLSKGLTEYIDKSISSY